MDGELLVAWLIGVAFGTALLVPGIQAYRGRYRSWIYRGTGARYGAFAIALGGTGIILMITGATIGPGHEVLYFLIGVPGFLLIVAGLIGFVWMPRALIPTWRRERLDNARLYRSGTERARLASTAIHLTGDRTLVVHRRAAPIVDSEYVALSVTGIHVRPRLRLTATLSGALPDGVTGARTDVITDIRGDLLADADAVVFVQAPVEDAEHKENCFAVVPTPPDRSEVADSPSGATWTLTLDDNARPITITVAGTTAAALHDDLQHATRPRRFGQNIRGELIR